MPDALTPAEALARKLKRIEQLHAENTEDWFPPFAALVAEDDEPLAEAA